MLRACVRFSSKETFFLRRVLVGIGEAARSGDSDAHECIECKCGSVVLEKKGMTMTSPLHLYHVDFLLADCLNSASGDHWCEVAVTVIYLCVSLFPCCVVNSHV